MVRMVSSSAGEGPGAVISRGFTERRCLRSSRASGMVSSFGARLEAFSDAEIVGK
jgi:hypothetical protein